MSSMWKSVQQKICVLAVIAGVVCPGSPVSGQGSTRETASIPRALADPIANYTIQARLDAARKTLEGKEIVTWRNAQGVAATELRFHLYWNAWKNNKSTWMREVGLRGRPAGPSDWAYCDVKTVKLLGEEDRVTDLTAQMKYDAPDDGNADDTTVLLVPLPKAVKPGESIRVELEWKSKIPRTIARTGYRGDFFFLAHWFPALGVWQSDGTWNCHQFHATTEFFSDYGAYEVEMTVPAGWLLGATGVQQEVKQNADGTATHRYAEQDVHTFTWTTSPDYREAKRRFADPGLPAVEMRLLYQPEHEGQVERHFLATEAALRYYGTWFGAYPYGHITIVDPAYGSGAGGMEYPTLFTCGTRYLNPFGGGSPEGVTIHEAGHQFWYGIVGNNEFEHAWLDEGLNTFSETRTTFVAYGAPAYVQRFFRGFFPVMIPEIRQDRTTDLGIDGYRGAARRNAQSDWTFRYYPGTAGSITYAKTGLWLETLERTLGWEKLQKIMSTHFERWKFKHPKPEDFFAVADEVAGENLTGFFEAVWRNAVVFDYSVELVQSEEVKTQGYVWKDGKYVLTGEGGAALRLRSGQASSALTPEQAASSDPTTEKKAAEKLYETKVIVRRNEDGVLPVEVLLKFENGEEVRELWDGKSFWKQYTMVKAAKLDYAAVDPEHKLALDINYTNNSKRLTAQADLPALKWASKWMIWLQDWLQTMLFFA